MSQPHPSPIVSTNIGKARNMQQRQVHDSDKSPQMSQGRTSQQLRASMEENRKRNLVNVS